jgi:hypothetical protein
MSYHTSLLISVTPSVTVNNVSVVKNVEQKQKECMKNKSHWWACGLTMIQTAGRDNLWLLIGLDESGTCR